MEGEQPSGMPQRGMLVREIYFPTPIYFQDLPDAEKLNETIKTEIYSLRSQDEEGIVRSNVKRAGSWHSRLDLHLHEAFRPLTTQVLAALQGIFENLGYDAGYEPAFDNMWAIINAKHGYNRSHIHPNVLWSGVYYVQAPADSGRIFFTDPRPQALMLTPRYAPAVPRKPECWAEVYYQPIEGRLILFPAWLVHEVEPNLSDKDGQAGDRISISFNFYQKRRQNV